MPPPNVAAGVELILASSQADNDLSLVLKANQKEEENDPSRYRLDG